MLFSGRVLWRVKGAVPTMRVMVVGVLQNLLVQLLNVLPKVLSLEPTVKDGGRQQFAGGGKLISAAFFDDLAKTAVERPQNIYVNELVIHCHSRVCLFFMIMLNSIMFYCLITYWHFGMHR